MKSNFIFLLSTLVLSTTVFSAPHEPSPDTDKVSVPANESEKRKAEKDLSTLTVAPAQEAQEGTHDKVYFAYSQSISSRLGAGYYLTIPSDPPGDEDHLFFLFGIQYMLKSLTHRHWEVGIDVLSKSRANLHAGLKWITKSSEKFRPFYKVSIVQRWDRQDGLESLVDYKSYSVRGTGGFELMIFDPASLRFDLDIQAGVDEVTALATLGYSWPW